MNNLPDGCRESDLPDNSAKDVFIEEWMYKNWASANWIEEYCGECGCPLATDNLSTLSLKELAHALGKEYVAWLDDVAENMYESDRRA